MMAITTTSQKLGALAYKSYELRQFIQGDLHLQDIFWCMVAPVLVFLTVLVAFGMFVKYIKKLWFPPTVDALHIQALKILQSMPVHKVVANDHNGCLKKTKKLPKLTTDEEEQAEKLLRKAIRKQEDSSYYTPAILSLAALYTYRQGKTDCAIRLLKSRILSFECDDQIDAASSMLSDARAMQSGEAHMVETDLCQVEYLSIRFAKEHSVMAKAAKEQLETTNSQDCQRKKPKRS
jgi:hypothetical protein